MWSNKKFYVALLAFCVFNFITVSAQLKVTVLINANVIDGVSSAVKSNQTIIIKNGLIESISSSKKAYPKNANVIDVQNNYVLPGLIDAHAHVDNIENAQRALSYGTTTIRSASVGSYADVALQRLVLEGRVVGPEIIPTGVYVQPNLGRSILATPELSELYDGVETEEAIRKLVQINIKNGVQYIKTRSAEMAGSPTTDPRKQVYTEEQLGFIVDEAAKAGIPVMTHSHAFVMEAVRAGVKSIEHGTYASKEALELMKEKGTYFVPTYSTVLDLTQPGGDYDHPVTTIRGQYMLPQMAKTVRLAIKIGVPFAAATDSRYGPKSLTRVSTEVMNFVMLGMTPQQALATATLEAAKLLGIADRTGSLEVGKEADIIVVYGNPLEEISAIQDVITAISNGNVFLNRLPFEK